MSGVKQAPKTPSPPLVRPVYQEALLILNPRLAFCASWGRLVSHCQPHSVVREAVHAIRASVSAFVIHDDNAGNLYLFLFIYSKLITSS
jgi:hypothetical protein